MTAVVLLSGGLDSAVALAITKDQGESVIALTVDYGQRHRREIRSAEAIAKFYGVQHALVTVDPVLFGGSALTGSGELPDGLATAPDSTYVPARNSVLLALGAAYAESHSASQVVIGANADDATAYPDCRRDFIESMRHVLMHGTVSHVWVAAPLLALTKPEIVGLATRLRVPIELTWSCYAGGVTPCGRCGACVSRETAR